MAGIKAPIESILKQLSTLKVKDADGITDNLYSRVWNNQMELLRSADESYPIPFPCAFVELNTPIQFEMMGVGFRNADLGIRIHILHQFFNNDGTFEQDMEIFDLRDRVVTLLHGFSPDACNQMMCIGENPEYDHDNIYHYVLEFVTNFTDSKGSVYDPERGEKLVEQVDFDANISNVSEIVREDDGSANGTDILPTFIIPT